MSSPSSPSSPSSLPSINVFDISTGENLTKQTKKYKKPKQKKRSTWLITINTQQRFHGTEEEFYPFVDKFKDVLGRLFSHENM